MTTDASVEARQPAGLHDAPPGSDPPWWRTAGPHLRRWGVLGTFLLAFLVFAAAKPEQFLAWDNFSNILSSSAVPMIVACGVTVPLIMSDFDLSIGGVVAFGGSIAVVLQAEQQWYWVGAAAATLAIGLLWPLGLPLGLLVALDLVLAGLVAIESARRLQADAEAGAGPEPSARAGLS